MAHGGMRLFEAADAAVLQILVGVKRGSDEPRPRSFKQPILPQLPVLVLGVRAVYTYECARVASRTIAESIQIEREHWGLPMDAIAGNPLRRSPGVAVASSRLASPWYD